MITLLQNDGKYSQDAKDARRAVSFGDVENWENDYLNFYSRVAMIATDDLEDAFHIHNSSRAFGLDDHRIETIKVHHSMSVGDIVRDAFGNHYMVCGEGFEQLLLGCWN
jgi:hypothetical protein